MKREANYGMLCLLYLTVLATAGCLGKALSTTTKQPGTAVPPEFSYPRAVGAVEYEKPFRAPSLAGLVIDASGTPREKVLVEITDDKWQSRIEAQFTTATGHFAFGGPAKGAFHLRVSLDGFDTLRLVVIVDDRAKKDLVLELPLSR